MGRRALAALAVLSLAWPPLAVQAEDTLVRIGVLAFRGADHAVRRWSPTADYLSSQVPGYRFQVMPLSLIQTDAAVRSGAVDFVLTNPGNYAELEARYGASRIATMRSVHRGEAEISYGAVIFTRADRGDIKTLADLKGKSFMAVSPSAFGGFQMAWRELKDNGIDPFDDFNDLRFNGFPQDAIAYAVRDGVVDAGTFRTGLLETMATEKRIRMSDFRILNAKPQSAFPWVLSTRLYPEWPFARLKSTSSGLALKVAIALLSLPANSFTAKAGSYSGWTVPSDYQGVHELFRVLGIGPYENRGQVTLSDVLAQYWQWIIFIGVVLALTVGRTARIEQLVTRRTAELSQANEALENQIVERRRAEEESRHHQAELAHVYRVGMIGEMASSIAHEINQPLSAIANYAQGCVRRLQSRRGHREEMLEALQGISEQAERAGAILRRIRGFVRKEGPEQKAIDVNDAIREATHLLDAEAVRQNIQMRLTLTDGLPRVMADGVQVQQVMLNLARNAIEAMTEVPSGRRHLSITTSAETDGENGVVVITVRDTGRGVALEETERIFDPFYTTKSDGLGLGLSICRSIVEDHGGRLRSVPEESPGAVFRVVFPAWRGEG